MGTGLRRAVAVMALAAVAAGAQGQAGPRRLTTLDALRQFPSYYHLQNVLLRGEFSENSQRLLFKSDANEMQVQLADGVTALGGSVEIRGQLVDVGRLEPGDPRAPSGTGPRDTAAWPRPGEELVLVVSGASQAPAPTPSVSVRGLALEPWKYTGQTVTVVGNFRGRNLFGDLPDAPKKSRYDFVVRASEGAVWVTDLRPRGKGFDLDVDRRLDTNHWVEVTGTVGHERGLVSVQATRLALAKAPTESRASEEPSQPAAPPPPVDIVFSTPTNGDTDIAVDAPVRVQFSKGLAEPTLAGRVTASYAGASPDSPGANLAVRTSYDAASRSIEIRFVAPLEPFQTVVVRLLDGITAFDKGALAPWTVTYSTGR